ncbi:alpha-ketoglutarate-dependent dioxygenase AlkB [Sphingobacterium kitahiroshimense]|uniref:alpha-ketoglutarate-dependent dioxygenase AlkB n=1 Tax=Sphingobacterium sp. B16(2022) TaxID=2914044 RepID=UPI0014389F5A|nr:alpha-ketoglutarate-dependent dioxygenase AlkB [Sphingobacterium sp. B16(2022)]NJI72297.1 alpha-ketoglutarate-dependent dioxygenase AlkB [Sphingobacterium sp. B16(2022)]
MYDLFNLPPDDFDNIPSINEGVDLSAIKGLRYIPNFITRSEERNLLCSINGETWLNDLKRRVQHYGYKYDYRARALNYSMYLGGLPKWATPFTSRIYAEKFIKEIPDQLIVNEYIPGQGIANHVDCQPCFGETIFSMSLGSTCLMDFVNVSSKEVKSLLLEPRSLLVMSDEARYDWSHGIAARKTDEFKGSLFPRGTRVSLTFRKVIF